MPTVASTPATQARERKPRGARALDLLIAATALANELPLSTRNPYDFEHLDAVGLQVHPVETPARRPSSATSAPRPCRRFDGYGVVIVDRGAGMRRLTSRLRFWMLGALLAVVAILELTTGLPGYWTLIVYGAAFAVFGAVMFAVIGRERGPMGDRSEFRHGNDMHGHYR